MSLSLARPCATAARPAPLAPDRAGAPPGRSPAGGRNAARRGCRRRTRRKASAAWRRRGLDVGDQRAPSPCPLAVGPDGEQRDEPAQQERRRSTTTIPCGIAPRGPGDPDVAGARHPGQVAAERAARGSRARATARCATIQARLRARDARRRADDARRAPARPARGCSARGAPGGRGARPRADGAAARAALTGASRRPSARRAARSESRARAARVRIAGSASAVFQPRPLM